MNISDYKENKEGLLKKLIERVNEIEQRERIVIKLPFNCELTRVEIYCSESCIIERVGWFGEKFDGMVSIQAFDTFTNKAIQKSSYSYKKELINFLPTMVDKLYKIAFKTVVTA